MTTRISRASTTEARAGEEKASLPPAVPIRLVSAAALFDGHDASINIIRRLAVRSGAEVIHLGHNRSAAEIVAAAIEEDVQGIAVSSYQGGHNEFFKYLIDLLREQGAAHVRVFGGGGGVIVPREIRALEAYGVTRIYSPQDGRRLGLQGMIDELLKLCSFDPALLEPQETAVASSPLCIARAITRAERAALNGQKQPGRTGRMPVVGITGTGGAGKSSLADELLLRMLHADASIRIAVLLVDPTKRVTGGALLADRIRMNAVHERRVFTRSLATRSTGSELSPALGGALRILESEGFDLCLVETSGIGQGDAAITEHADLSIYVMTPEFGAPTQLEKIDMLDLAHLVAINKFDRRGGQDALRDVRRQLRRTPGMKPGTEDESLPVEGTIASRFNDPGVNRLFERLAAMLCARLGLFAARVARPGRTAGPSNLLPGDRTAYLGEIVKAVRRHRRETEERATLISRLHALEVSAEQMKSDNATPSTVAEIERKAAELRSKVPADALLDLESNRREFERYRGERYTYQVRGRDHSVELNTPSLSGLKIPRIVPPRHADPGDLYRFVRLENLPGHFPFTAGVYPFKRRDEEPRRQFAGEGGPARTNRRFHFLSRHDQAKRLSVAFDSVTLYGEDPDERPDIYGKIGEGGVSISTLDDMKVLMDGFDLCDPNTSVSMTINGPAPILLAFFLNTAIDQQIERKEKELSRPLTSEEAAAVRKEALRVVRGTVQADILKEDQAQNTCIFSTDFALKLMGDIQEFFTREQVRNFYSVSISGYHIAEAGANPISQLAFTLSNGFTYVEYYLSRGLKIDEFAGNLSFFFSNGLDPEYAVLGRVARRIWSIALRDLYGASERSQKFKYHIQTSGRSLHAMEIDFNDIRTTLQALLAINDHCNSLHTNAYDEAITTPTEESVRRAMAIQMIIQREFGLTMNENPLQGSFLIEELTDLVEEAVLSEFERLNERGGVLGAMETHYQRGRIQDESLHYEMKKDTGELPIVGVNTFERPEGVTGNPTEDSGEIALARCSNDEKADQIRRLRDFQGRHRDRTAAALERLQQVSLSGDNVFAELMACARVASLGQITRALYEVGGRYRRSL